jgi:hypothetical protein
VPFTIAGNPALTPRTGYILIADQTLTITQAAGPAGFVGGYTLSTFAGGGSASLPANGDGGPALGAYFNNLLGLRWDWTTGTLYVVDSYNSGPLLRAITPDGNINTVAGGGSGIGENIPATSAQIGSAYFVGVDPSSALYVCDFPSRIRKIGQGEIATFAGGTNEGFTGDNSAATSALLDFPQGITADSAGNIYIADMGNHRIREVSGGIIDTVVGGGTHGLGDGGPATAATLQSPYGISFDGAGNLYIADAGSNLVRKVSQGIITTVAGGGTSGLGDGGPATEAELFEPTDVAPDPLGNLFVLEPGYLRIRWVSVNGTISTISPYGATPHGLATDTSGNVYYTDASPIETIRKFTPIPAFCSYSVGNVTSSVVAGAGATLLISVSAAAGCNWTASSSAPGVTITSGSSGTGNGSVSLSFAANTTGSARTIQLAIAGQLVNLTQLVDPPQLAFSPVTPCRVVDTRSYGGKTGAFGPPFISGGTERDFQLPSGSCDLPSTAQAYSLNVSVVPHTTLGYLTVWPTGSPFPTVSTLNSLDGRIVADAAIVPAGSSGSISVFASDDTDVFIDVDGYFAPPIAQGLEFYPVTLCRVADTRSYGGKTGAFGPPQMTAGEVRDFPVTSSACDIPDTAQAYALNITVSPATTLSYLTTWPAGGSFPLVSTLNDYDGGLVANAAMVPAGTNGDIDVYATDATDVIIDINGYFAAPGDPGALYFYPLPPCRVADTRSYGGMTGAFGPPTMSGGTARSFPVISSSCSVPGTAQAYSFNMTVWPSAPVGYLTTWPTGQAFPTVSTLNSPSGQPVSNAALVPAGTTGEISIFVSNTTDLFFDINGYFAP